MSTPDQDQNECPFFERQLVVKNGNGYPYGGYFLGAVTKMDGRVLANVESVLHPGMVHVFPIERLVAYKGTLDQLAQDHYAMAVARFTQDEDTNVAYLKPTEASDDT